MESYTLRHPDIVKIGTLLMSVYAVFVGGLIGLSLGILPGLLVILIANGIVFLEFLHVLTKIKYDQENIELKKVFQQPVTFKWDDIGGVSYSIRSFRLSNSQGNELSAIDQNMIGVERFFEIFFQKKPIVFDLTIPKTLIRKTSTILMLFIIFTVAGGTLFWIFFRISMPIGIFVGLAPAFYIIYLFLKAPRTIAFSRNSLIISSMTTDNNYRINQIDSIDLELKRYRNVNHFNISLSKSNDKPVKVYLLGHSNIILYYQLLSWFNKVKR